MVNTKIADDLGPPLLTWINFNLSMDKYLHPLKINEKGWKSDEKGWINLYILKLQWCNR